MCKKILTLLITVAMCIPFVEPTFAAEEKSVPVETSVNETFTVELPLSVKLMCYPNSSDSSQMIFEAAPFHVYAKGNLKENSVLTVTPPEQVVMANSDGSQQFTIPVVVTDTSNGLGNHSNCPIKWLSKIKSGVSHNGMYTDDSVNYFWEKCIDDVYKNGPTLQIGGIVSTPLPATYTGNMRFTISVD